MKNVFEMVMGFAYTNALYALISTGVIDQIENDPKTLNQIAKACNLHEDVLFRTLRFGIAIGIVNLKDGAYSLTESGSVLSKNHPRSMANAVKLVVSEPWQKSWRNISRSVQTGVTAFNDVYGEDLFTYLGRNPQYLIPFNNQMTSNSIAVAPAIVNSYNFSKATTVCDIGGGQGYLLSAILDANPGAKGILFDQDNTVSSHALQKFGNRVEVLAGNFFEKVPSADIMIMKNVIHDWNDQDSIKILETCKKAMLPDSKLLLIELLIGDEADFIGCFFDLHMQALIGGKERTVKEFENLFSEAGLKMGNVYKTGSPMHIIEASL